MNKVEFTEVERVAPTIAVAEEYGEEIVIVGALSAVGLAEMSGRVVKVTAVEKSDTLVVGVTSAVNTDRTLTEYVTPGDSEVRTTL